MAANQWRQVRPDFSGGNQALNIAQRSFGQVSDIARGMSADIDKRAEAEAIEQHRINQLGLQEDQFDFTKTQTGVTNQLAKDKFTQDKLEFDSREADADATLGLAAGRLAEQEKTGKTKRALTDLQISEINRVKGYEQGAMRIRDDDTYSTPLSPQNQMIYGEGLKEAQRLGKEREYKAHFKYRTDNPQQAEQDIRAKYSGMPSKYANDEVALMYKVNGYDAKGTPLTGGTNRVGNNIGLTAAGAREYYNTATQGNKEKIDNIFKNKAKESSISYKKAFDGLYKTDDKLKRYGKFIADGFTLARTANPQLTPEVYTNAVAMVVKDDSSWLTSKKYDMNIMISDVVKDNRLNPNNPLGAALLSNVSTEGTNNEIVRIAQEANTKVLYELYGTSTKAGKKLFKEQVTEYFKGLGVDKKITTNEEVEKAMTTLTETAPPEIVDDIVGNLMATAQSGATASNIKDDAFKVNNKPVKRSVYYQVSQKLGKNKLNSAEQLVADSAMETYSNLIGKPVSKSADTWKGFVEWMRNKARDPKRESNQ